MASTDDTRKPDVRAAIKHAARLILDATPEDMHLIQIDAGDGKAKKWVRLTAEQHARIGPDGVLVLADDELTALRTQPPFFGRS